MPSDLCESFAVEQRVLANINGVLTAAGVPELERITQLYHAGPKRVLLTFQELDHCPQRNGERYWGYWPFQPGAVPEWPNVSGSRVFCYLKRFPGLTNILSALGRICLPVLAYVDGLEATLRHQLQAETLRFADKLVDLSAAVRECSVVVSHGGLGTTTASLLCGKPVLSLPLHLEQILVAKAVERLQAGATLPPDRPTALAGVIEALLQEARYRECAQGFESRNRDFDPRRQDEQLGAFVEGLLGTGTASHCETC